MTAFNPVGFTKAHIVDLETITVSPAAGAVPKADGAGKIDNGWLKTGSGNGLDADLLDGNHASAFALLSGASFTGNVTVTGAMQVGTGSTMTSYEHRTFGDAYVDGCLNVGDKAQTTPISGGMLFARSGTSEPFIRFATQSGVSGCGQIRGIDGGGIRITNFNGATEWFKIGADGVPDFNSNTLRIRISKTPASANAAGNAGDICWDGNYLYICTATNTWRRIAHESWT